MPDRTQSTPPATTALAEWRAFLTKYGIGFVERNDMAPLTFLVLEQGASKVAGYNGFEVQIQFSEDDSFVEIGAWE